MNIKDLTFETLLEMWKETHKAAIAVSDKMRRHEDHVIYEGGTEIVDDLQELLSENDHVYNNILYGDKNEEDDPA